MPLCLLTLQEHAHIVANNHAASNNVTAPESVTSVTIAAKCGVGIKMLQSQKGIVSVASVISTVIPGESKVNRSSGMGEEEGRGTGPEGSGVGGGGGAHMPQVGDVVLAIDGKGVCDVGSAPSLCLGPEGSQVTLLLGTSICTPVRTHTHPYTLTYTHARTRVRKLCA